MVIWYGCVGVVGVLGGVFIVLFLGGFFFVYFGIVVVVVLYFFLVGFGLQGLVFLVIQLVVLLVGVLFVGIIVLCICCYQWCQVVFVDFVLGFGWIYCVDVGDCMWGGFVDEQIDCGN